MDDFEVFDGPCHNTSHAKLARSLREARTWTARALKENDRLSRDLASLAALRSKYADLERAARRIDNLYDSADRSTWNGAIDVLRAALRALGGEPNDR